MLLGNRRHRLLFLALAGMDVAWFLPFPLTWAAFSVQRQGDLAAFSPASLLLRPLPLFLLCWGAMICYMFLADLLNRQELGSPARELVILGLLLGTSLIAARLLLYSTAPAWDVYWLADSASAVFNFTAALRPPLLLLLINAYLWIRVAAATDRGISFFGVGVTFRLGLLLAIIGGALLTTVGGQPTGDAITFFAIFFAFGLIAVALARIDEKALGAANSTGALLPWPRLAQLLAIVLLLTSAALALTRVFNPQTLRALVSVFDPLWSAIGWVLVRLLAAFFLLIGPLLERLVLYFQALAAGIEPQPMVEPAGPLEYGSVETIVREWAALRYCLVGGAIVLALLVVLLFFVRTRPRTRVDEAEESVPEAVTVDVGLERMGLGRLRAWLNLLRRHGLSRRLLAAVSVQNMYANLSRLARQRGHGRAPAQAPDDYLPALNLAFPGRAEQLQRITLAYMRVHYGDQGITQTELEPLRQDYARVIAPPSESDATEPSSGDNQPRA